MKKILLFLSMLTIAHFSNAQNVGIGTTEPDAKLQVAGNFLVSVPTKKTSTAATAAQTKTMVNAGTTTFLGTDSTGIVYDPGGASGNYLPSLTSMAAINDYSPSIGIEIMAESLQLGTGDSLIIKPSAASTNILLAVGNGYTGSGSKWLFSSSQLYILFKSNADAGVGSGFKLLFRRLFDNSSSLPEVGSIPGRGFFFDSKTGSLRAGVISDAERGQVSTAFGVSTKASGTFSTALGYYTNASGNFSTAMGNGTDAVAEYSTTMGYGTVAMDRAATAMGIQTVASGISSTSMGKYSKASGENSTAMGLSSSATGLNSTATGSLSVASGDHSTAMGSNTTASGTASFAIGANAVATNIGAIAMGTDVEASGVWSTAIGQGSVATKNYGTAIGRQTTSDGVSAVAMGYHSKALANEATAMGSGTTASGIASTAMGFETVASGLGSTAMGYETTASGANSTAMGDMNTASGGYSTAMGYLNTAAGNFSTAMGSGTSASGYYSSAMGRGTTSRGYAGTVVGMYNFPILAAAQTTVAPTTPLFIVGNGNGIGDQNNALSVLKNGNVGIGTLLPPVTKLQVIGGTDADLSFGSGYLVLGETNSTNIVIDNNEIMARNGGAVTTLYLQNDGGALETGGTASKPGGGSWSATSDARLKDHVLPYTDGLQQLQQINPVSFNYNQQSGYDTSKQFIGVVAQELQKVAPYMVGSFKKDNTDYLNVDNTAMTYMLINAVKEQQLIINKQQAEINELKELMKKLIDNKAVK